MLHKMLGENRQILREWLLRSQNPPRLFPLVFAMLLGLLVLTTGAACTQAPNNPYVEGSAAKAAPNTLYTAFTARPKHLDPAKSYTSDEAEFTYQIYEPLLQYHYLKRPYTLEPLAAQTLPTPVLLDAKGHALPANAPAAQVHTSVYVFSLRPGVLYQPHPAFVREADGRYTYHALGAEVQHYHAPGQFAKQATRELTAHDYVYQIKRLASPRVVSPILGHMREHIVGLDALAKTLQSKAEPIHTKANTTWLDLRQFALDGVRAVDDHTLEIRIHGAYPQFVYWLAMPFFAPVPWEVDAFYSQDGFVKNNLSLDWWPVGTGPYMLQENDPNRRMVLVRNPNFRGESYPSEGEPSDTAHGLLADAGKAMPFIDRVVFTREKESIPYWNKFLQGYYDTSGVGAETFDQVVRMAGDGDVALSADMQAKGMRLETSVSTSLYYLGFNALDPVVGSNPGTAQNPAQAAEAERARLLRQAIAMVVDWEEFSQVFTNGRAVPAHGPIPPGLFGYQEGVEGYNTQVYTVQGGKPVRKPVAEAQALLAKAGYANGIDPKTGQPLVLALDTTGGGPGDKARFDWYRKQLAKLNIQLEIRATDWNRFQDKIKKGSAQLFFLGWNADYPDPENFLFLLYGPNARAITGGENAANYRNPKFDALFEQMRAMPNGPERAAIIADMVRLVQHDVPWVFAFVPKQFGLVHGWLHNVKPNDLARNDLKYHRINSTLRAEQRQAWNQPQWWPLPLLLLAVLLLVWPAYHAWRKRQRQVGLRADLALNTPEVNAPNVNGLKPGGPLP